MMTDPAFAIKHEVEHLIAIQIGTLGKPSSLTSSDLDETRRDRQKSQPCTANWTQCRESDFTMFVKKRLEPH